MPFIISAEDLSEEEKSASTTGYVVFESLTTLDGRKRGLGRIMRFLRGNGEFLIPGNPVPIVEHMWGKFSEKEYGVEWAEPDDGRLREFLKLMDGLFAGCYRGQDGAYVI